MECVSSRAVATVMAKVDWRSRRRRFIESSLCLSVFPFAFWMAVAVHDVQTHHFDIASQRSQEKTVQNTVYCKMFCNKHLQAFTYAMPRFIFIIDNVSFCSISDFSSLILYRLLKRLCAR